MTRRVKGRSLKSVKAEGAGVSAAGFGAAGQVAWDAVRRALDGARDEELSRDRDAELVLAFDADGTIWAGDVGYDALFSLLARGVRPEAAEALRQEAREAGLAAEGAPRELVLRLCQAYFEGRYDEKRAFSMMAWCFAGHGPAELDELFGHTIEQGDLSQRVAPAVRRALDWAHERSVACVVVSASPERLVARAVEALALRFSRVLGMDVARDARGRWLPFLASEPTWGPGKLAALRGAYPRAVLLGAFGDGGWDAPMLRAARVRVAMGAHAPLTRVEPPIEGLLVLP